MKRLLKCRQLLKKVATGGLRMGGGGGCDGWFKYDRALCLLVANVVERGDRLALSLDGVRDLQRVNELGDGGLRHLLILPRQLLQRLVRLRVRLTTQDVLDSLGHNRPVVVQVAVDGRVVDDQLVQAAEQSGERDHRVAHRDADVPQDGGVRKVALQTRDRELLRQVLEDGVGHAQVALGVLKVDGVDLVRHGAAADLARDDLLLEVLVRDVRPDVAGKVDQDRVDALDAVEDGTHVVVVLNLRRVLLPLQTQRVLAEVVRELLPVHVREGCEVRVHVARRSTELARLRHRLQQGQLPLDALDEHLHLLRHVRGRRGLAVGARQHGEVPLVKRLAQLRKELLDGRVVLLLQGVLDQQRNGGVVDVLRREGKVDPLLVVLQTDGVHGVLQEVLDGLDVVVRRLLRRLDLRGALHVEVLDQQAQGVQLGVRDVLAVRDGAHQLRKVLDFDMRAVLDEPELAVELGQVLRRTAVATVNRRHGRELRQIHRRRGVCQSGLPMKYRYCSFYN
eukprot:Rhum_TRINITY_DN20712_c0_g1::Rhum_TRINITY_DN20712_c0_g1_i1::g.171949::m.171949